MLLLAPFHPCDSVPRRAAPIYLYPPPPSIPPSPMRSRLVGLTATASTTTTAATGHPYHIRYVVRSATMLLPLLLLLAAGVAAGTGTPTLVFILAGQSNMGGRGGATSGKWDGFVPPQCAPSPRVLRLSPSLLWEEAREPLHAGIDVGNVLGVGPGMPFAHAVLAARHDQTIGLVPCAQGGTPIANWSRGTDLYDRMLTRARAAVAETAPHGGKLAAMLWFQGETDTIRREDAEAYKGRMEAMVRDVRRDLGMPDLLVIQVGIATGQGKFIDLVRKAQRAVKLPNLKYVDAKGLPIASDYTHLTTQAQVRLGKMLAQAYLATL